MYQGAVGRDSYRSRVRQQGLIQLYKEPFPLLQPPQTRKLFRSFLPLPILYHSRYKVHDICPKTTSACSSYVVTCLRLLPSEYRLQNWVMSSTHTAKPSLLDGNGPFFIVNYIPQGYNLYLVSRRIRNTHFKFTSSVEVPYSSDLPSSMFRSTYSSLANRKQIIRWRILGVNWGCVIESRKVISARIPLRTLGLSDISLGSPRILHVNSWH